MTKYAIWFFVLSARMLMIVPPLGASQPSKKPTVAGTVKNAVNITEGTASPSTVVDTKTIDSVDTGNKNSKLTGIPQIDYIWDPNLPRELRGFNLSNYPFFATVPTDDEIHFQCDGLHDGFYASIEHKCQVYHHCVYGIRHDFLCANFTAFDQKTFICHFVSDVDCENSQKYWNRNDDLYMATTTSSTTTTTIEPPVAPRRRPMNRPHAPLRRPISHDYYYGEEEYEDDYYEERLNQRRKQYQRHRIRPQVDYDDRDYDERRSLDDDTKRRRPGLRPHYSEDDDLGNYYDVDASKYEQSRSSMKSTSALNRGRINGRKSSTLVTVHPYVEDRFSSNKHRHFLAANVDGGGPLMEELPLRKVGGRRRPIERASSFTPSPNVNNFDDIPFIPDQGDYVELGSTKDKYATKASDAFITPKPELTSIYARPRGSSRIARPIPKNVKKKYQYPGQKILSTEPPTMLTEDTDYYDESFSDMRRQRGHNRRRIFNDAYSHHRPSHDDDDLVPMTRRRNAGDSIQSVGKKFTRTTLPRPITDKKSALYDEVLEITDSPLNERLNSRGLSRRRHFANRNRNAYSSTYARDAEDVDFVDDDNNDRPVGHSGHRMPLGPASERKNVKISQPYSDEDEDAYESTSERNAKPAADAMAVHRKNILAASQRKQIAKPSLYDDNDDDENAQPAFKQNQTAGSSALPVGNVAAMTRVVKRPFLPSRGGGPHLPRGLQLVGVSSKTSATPSIDSKITKASSNSASLRRTELNANSNSKFADFDHEGHQVSQSKATLDDLYENEYDVTLNDALNPTLKPLKVPHAHYQHDSASSSALNARSKEYFENSPSTFIQHEDNQQYQSQEHPLNYAAMQHHQSSPTKSLKRTQEQSTDDIYENPTLSPPVTSILNRQHFKNVDSRRIQPLYIGQQY